MERDYQWGDKAGISLLKSLTLWVHWSTLQPVQLSSLTSHAFFFLQGKFTPVNSFWDITFPNPQTSLAIIWFSLALETKHTYFIVIPCEVSYPFFLQSIPILQLGKWNKSNEIQQIRSDLRCLLHRKIVRKLFTCSMLISLLESRQLGYSELLALLHVGQNTE